MRKNAKNLIILQRNTIIIIKVKQTLINIIINQLKTFCSFHKVNSHSDSECRALKRNKHNNKTDKNKKTYALWGSISTPKIIEIPISIDKKNYRAMKDTGSLKILSIIIIIHKLNASSNTLQRL
ncbi:hypothetical protein DMUE_3749 [Dictyocoela muelleri]|nr:hypothetical protein DMUE_3749 [Dictyocoela muelleri]